MNLARINGYAVLMRLLLSVGQSLSTLATATLLAQLSLPFLPSHAQVYGQSGIASFVQPYRLGPGDRLHMAVFKVEGYTADVEVLSDGTINLPRLGSVMVWGLTLNQARQRITLAYEAILRRPLVYVDLREARPVRITVSGEVQRPGLYSLLSRGGMSQLSSAGPVGQVTNVGTTGWPTLVDAIQRAGGITAMGDLGDIEILRPSGIPGVLPERFQYNFLTVLSHGGIAQNPLVYDGDTIQVPRAAAQSHEQLFTSAASSFAPDTIQVQVVGEVARPGAQQIRSSSPLAMAIHAAGGLSRRAAATTVQLIRLGPDGKHQVWQLQFDPGATLSSANNPPMHQGDVVVVDRHRWAKFNDSVRDTFEPLGPVINAASIFKLFGL
jgi:polysaccharide export outer membrane protein